MSGWNRLVVYIGNYPELRIVLLSYVYSLPLYLLHELSLLRLKPEIKKNRFFSLVEVQDKTNSSRMYIFTILLPGLTLRA